jgi:hypothetical protein
LSSSKNKLIKAVALDCSNKKSKSYCPDPTFFSRIGSTYLTPNGCYYYNSTSTIVEEVAISTSQVIKLTNNNPDFTPISVFLALPRNHQQLFIMAISLEMF